MKARILTGIVGGALALIILLFCPTICTNIAISVVCALAIYEILIATKFVDHRGMMAAALAFAIVCPYFMLTETRTPALIALLLYVLVLVLIQLCYHESLSVERTGFVFFVS